MTIARTRRSEKAYQKYLAKQPEGCEFCRIDEGHPQFVKATKSFKVIHNRFPYYFWDDQTVADHLMVVPKAHIDSLALLTPEQAVEYVKLIGDYENRGYHVYARALRSVSRTIAHQHTHLIKGVGEPKQFVVQITKPHVLIAR